MILCIPCLVVAGLMPFIPCGGADSRLDPTTIEFLGPGYNTDLVENAPHETIVNTATMDITGIMRLGGSVTNAYDFADRGESKAYVGGDCQVPPWKASANLQGTELTDQNYTDVQALDGTRVDSHYGLQMSCQCSGTYHHFKFVIQESTATGINVTWAGWGGRYYTEIGSGLIWDHTFYLFIYNHTGASWEELDNATISVLTDQTLTGAITSSTDDYISSGNTVSVLAVTATAFGMSQTEKTEIHTNYIGINITSHAPDSWPTNPALDVGNDGDLQWHYNGEFKTTETVDFRVELQRIIDDAGPGSSTIPVVFNLSSESAGLLRISNINIKYQLGVPPTWTSTPTVSDTTMVEDGDGDNMVDLLDHVLDDGPESELTFLIIQNDKPTDLQVRIDNDGHHLDVTPRANWWGETQVRVRVRDGDGYTADSDPFKVIVTSVNDRPTIVPLLDRTLNQGDTLFMTVEADDVDMEYDPTKELFFSDDTDLFDINETTGVIEFTSTQDDVGLHYIMITVKDDEGEGAMRDFQLTVLNTNDAPSIAPIQDVTLERGDVWGYSVEADDKDFEVDEIEALTFTVDSSLVAMNSTTGHMSFTPTKADIGTHTVTVTVHDASLASVSTRFNMTVTWSNHPPTAQIVTEANRTTFKRGSVVKLTAMALDPDGDDLNYTWKDGEEVVGYGQTIDLEGLDVGTHNITLAISDGEDSTEADLEIEIIKKNPKGNIGMMPGLEGIVMASTFLFLGAMAFFMGGTEVGKYNLFLFLLPLYSKIKKEEVLDQYTRGRIHGYITANPGAHYSAIRVNLTLNNGTLAYHLQKLENEGFIWSRRDGTYKRFFPSGYAPNGTMLSTLQERIVEHVVEHPGDTKKELAKALDKSPQVLEYHLRWMSRQDLLKIEKDGKLNRYYIPESMDMEMAATSKSGD